MRKGMWSAAALIMVLSGAAAVVGTPGVRAADTTVNMVEAPGDVTKTWGFDPATVTIPAGSSVVWHNNGEQVHTATGSGFDTGDVGRGKDSKPIPFPTAGRFDYICTPHPWMKGVVVVTGGSTPAPAPTATTQPAASGAAPTTTTAKAGAAAAGATTTTAKNGSGSPTTTTTTAGTGVTATTQAPSVTPTSAPDPAGETTTTTAAGGAEESAATDHASEGGSEKKKQKSSPIGIAFAAVSTLLLTAIAGKLLASKP